MKQREIEPLLEEHLLPVLVTYRVKGGFAYSVAGRRLLRLVTFNFSRFDARHCRVVAGVQPLYVPSDFMGYLRRIELGSWTLHSGRESDVFAEIRKVVADRAVPYLEQYREPLDYARLAPTDARGRPPLGDMEAIGYSLVLADREEEGVAVLESFLSRLKTTQRERPAALRAHEVLQEVRRQPGAARATLDEWSEHTLRVLGLANTCC